MSSTPAISTGSESLNSLVSSFLVILVSEIGDKTFLINCIMAMRNPRLIVFSGAMGALALMSALSAALGYTLPQLLSRRVTQWLAALLFIGFGLKMIKEAQDMTGDEVENEMQEVSQELLEKEEADKQSRIETGGQENITSSSASESWQAKLQAQLHSLNQVLQYVLSPVFIQCFVLTFLAEWGDRSQISTIVLAAAQSPFWVTIGAILGHAVCTGGAVIGGQMIASKISVKTVTQAGAALFLAFGAYTVYELMTGELPE